MCSTALCTSSAEELFIISRLSRSAERSKRIFTGGVVAANGICSAAFCESAALGGIPPQSLLRKASSPKGTPYGNAGNFAATAKSRPLGEGGIAAGDDGRGKFPLAKKIIISGSDGGQKPKISITACFSALKKVQNR